MAEPTDPTDAATAPEAPVHARAAVQPRSLAVSVSARKTSARGKLSWTCRPMADTNYTPAPPCRQRRWWSPLLLLESQATREPGGHPRPPFGVRLRPCSGLGSSGEKTLGPQLRTRRVGAVGRASTTAATYPRETQPLCIVATDQLLRPFSRAGRGRQFP